MNKILLFSLILLLGIQTTSAVIGKLSSVKFASIKFNEVNVHTGPAGDTPVDWVFIKKGEPVEVVAEYDQWRKIRDIKGEGGWIRATALSLKKRSVIITSENVVPLLAKPKNYDKVVAKVEPQYRCELRKCEDDSCQVSCNSYKGWINKKYLWGI